jgi:hypothetical protein
MPASELRKWAEYLQARPIGWREDQRTSLLMNAQGVKKAGHEIFPSLLALQKWQEDRADEDVMRQSLGKSVFGALLESANKKG